MISATIATRKHSFLLLFLFMMMGTVSVSTAQELPEAPKGHVNDYVGLLSNSERARLERDLRNYRDTTTNVISVAILESLNGYTEEEAATKLFSDWKMWHEDRYNGILILIVPSARSIRIETGYGLEGAFPDAVAKKVIDDIISPNFSNNQYYKGLDEATKAIMGIISGEFTGSLTKKQTDNGLFEILKVVAFFGFIFFFILASRNKKGGNGGHFYRGRRRYHSIGSGGIFIGTGGFGGSGGFSGGGGFGGFSGGGGFGSGGGGAGGSW